MVLAFSRCLRSGNFKVRSRFGDYDSQGSQLTPLSSLQSLFEAIERDQQERGNL